MKDSIFTFKQFKILHRKSIMKVGTDGVLLGAYADCKKAKRILDIGTGTGLLCLMLAQKSNAIIDGIDINEEAVEIATYNVETCKWKERISIKQSSLQEFEPCCKYDLIISNPPFYTTDVYSPIRGRAVARHDISLDCPELVSHATRLLSEDGRFYVIYPLEQAENCIIIAKKHELYLKRKLSVYSKPSTNPIRLILEFSKTESCTTEEKLYIENNERHNYTNEYKELTKDYYLNF